MGAIAKPLNLKKIKKDASSSIAKPEVLAGADATPTETEAERQLRIARQLRKSGNSYSAKLKAFNERLAKTTDFNDVPKMKG